MIGLRERRRTETLKQIQLSALRLAAQQDFDTVTVEAICAEAGVSQRTFFNYFPLKEAAFIIGPPPFDRKAIERFVSGDGPLFDNLVELVASRMPTSRAERRELRIMQEVLSRHPKVAAMHLSAHHAHEMELAGLIAQRAGTKSSKIASDFQVIAAAILAASRVVLVAWASEKHDSGAAPDLARGLAPLRDLLSSIGR